MLKYKQQKWELLRKAEVKMQELFEHRAKLLASGKSLITTVPSAHIRIDPY